MPIVPSIIIIYLLTLWVVFFTYFTAKIAQMKLRKMYWGALGMLLGPLGMLAVCYLPSRRKDGKETNPIRSGIRALPKASRKIFLVLLGVAVVTFGVIYLINFIPKWQENAQYEKNIGGGITDQLVYTTTVKGTPKSVVTGRDSTYLITEEGELYTWGYNNLSLLQEDKGAAASNVVSVAQVGRDVYLLKQDHKLYKINAKGKQTKFADNVARVVGAANYGAFITQSGDVYVWGDNTYGQLGNASSQGSKEPLWLAGNVSDVSCGGRHLLLLKKDGSVMACGSNVTGALGLSEQNDVPTLKQIATGCKAIAAGNDFSLLLTNDGVLKSSGANDCGQLGRTLDEEKKETEQVYLSFREVARGVEQIGAGGKSGWYISEDTLYTWGQNHCGQLGQGSQKQSDLPQEVKENVSTAAMSYDHLVLLSSDKVYLCGDNFYGQLGRLGETHFSPNAVILVRK